MVLPLIIPFCCFRFDFRTVLTVVFFFYFITIFRFDFRTAVWVVFFGGGGYCRIKTSSFSSNINLFMIKQKKKFKQLYVPQFPVDSWLYIAKGSRYLYLHILSIIDHKLNWLNKHPSTMPLVEQDLLTCSWSPSTSHLRSRIYLPIHDHLPLATCGAGTIYPFLITIRTLLLLYTVWKIWANIKSFWFMFFNLYFSV